MKKIIITIATLGCLVYGNTTLDQSIKNKIEILDKESEYETSRELLRDFIDKDNKIDAIKFWLSLDSKLLNKLNSNMKYQLTLINYKPMNKVKETVKDNLVYLIPYAGGMKTAYDAYNGDLAYQRNDKSIEGLKTKHIHLVPIRNAKQILTKYNELRKSQQALKRLLNRYIKESNINEFKTLLSILKNYKNLKNKIKTQRTNFVSYSVVSPYLADAHRNIIISNDDAIGHDESYLQKSARLMAKGAYNDILLESNEDVRNQFYNVFKLLKETAGEKELEDLKVLQTLMDSSSKQKQNGADKWWE